MIDIPSDGGKLRGERFDIRRIGVNDISVNRHLAEVGTIAPCGDLKIRKIASGYSLAVLAIETLPLFFPLLILQFGAEILAVRKRYIG